MSQCRMRWMDFTLTWLGDEPPDPKDGELTHSSALGEVAV